MKDGGRLAAAIDVLTEVDTYRRPVQDGLKEWGRRNRFAGSGDRLVIGNLVFDALRHKLSLSHIMGSTGARAHILATYALTWEFGVDGLVAALADDRFAPEPATAEERARLESADLDGAADHVRADVPEWLWSQFAAAYGADAVAEGQALARRAPIDLRVNRLKGDRDRVIRRMGHLPLEPTPISPVGLRLPPARAKDKAPHVQAEEGFRKGWFELQDEASQLAALVATSLAPTQVLDYCAGGGGKTLALAGELGNRGQIYAHDALKLRLAPIYERLQRSGARNVQVRDPQAATLDDLKDRMDLVFLDVPCSGTGVWRRRPDSKWRVTENALQGRLREQSQVLDAACGFVRPGGHLLYATCSLLPCENQQQLGAFLARNAAFEPVSLGERWGALFGEDAARPRFSEEGYATLSPATTGTDGFFIGLLRRREEG
ncbi:RsmB/NOP family class I SAM-dependent RNA methyltransferase [Stappia taiwanensis]|uniref:RsmB/NOP family class I SAM-dependent RNA methyltransferase n=1 Tax=Stappia taiwanensis TaxID=992267 RepID=A0A838XNJ6_9HYPH|nr:RsmB/NOP family class I SAM-dependent RNA methyltransferase [Stappia taiwanensis]MBA4611772.1 RsmB/NOP family class I SAM-dependent RNA methyltransferase [Stappia taiwanensis]GGE96909.1 MFS transporter [Stappia taiwanensis]